MRIIEKLNEFDHQYADDIKVQRNGTKLMGAPPRHYLFAPMSSEVQKELTASYRGDFPKELLRLYEVANGFALFLTIRKIAGYSIPMACLDIYGVPTEVNAMDALQPYNIRVEDLGRPKKTPKTWLKFGSYRQNAPNGEAERRLFVDTTDSCVYAVDADAKHCDVKEQWDSIDTCLCDLFDRLQNM